MTFATDLKTVGAKADEQIADLKAKLAAATAEIAALKKGNLYRDTY